VSFYLPLQSDWRGRIYTKPFLSHIKVVIYLYLY
jgi:hypothetical protein